MLSKSSFSKDWNGVDIAIQISQMGIINIYTFFVQNETNNWANHWYIAKTVEALILFLGEYHTRRCNILKGNHWQDISEYDYPNRRKNIMGNTWSTMKIYNLDNRISWSTVSNAFLRSRKATALTLPISIQASKQGCDCWMEHMDSRLVQSIMIREIGKELLIDNSFKYFANYRDNWYCTIIVYVASFTAYYE